MKILVSACLMGVRCRYDGKSKTYSAVQELAKHHTLIPVCPEQLGGLATPRVPAERQGERVTAKNGTDVTAQYRRGAEEALRLCEFFGCEAAVLKARSPSCGRGQVYDGTFTGTLTEGDGVTARLLADHGIAVYSEEQIGELLR